MADTYWKDAKRDRRAHERRVGTYICGCSRKVWMNEPKCLYCGEVNYSFKPKEATGGKQS